MYLIFQDELPEAIKAEVCSIRILFFYLSSNFYGDFYKELSSGLDGEPNQWTQYSYTWQ